jgi:pilus assembly protein CpaB
MNPRQRRAILLLAIAAAGLIGVFALVANYVSGVDTQVGPKIRVLELTRGVKANDTIEDNMVAERLIPERWAPKAALRDRSQLVGVAAADLAANSILEEGMVVPPPEIKPGEREVAILVDASTGVAGKISPDRLVDVIAAYPADQQTKRPPRSVVLVSGARVIAVGTPRLKGGNGVQDAARDPSQVVPVTFALNKLQELNVSYAESFAQDVRLALLPQGDESTERTLDETIYRGEDPTSGVSGTGSP